MRGGHKPSEMQSESRELSTKTITTMEKKEIGVYEFVMANVYAVAMVLFIGFIGWLFN